MYIVYITVYFLYIFSYIFLAINVLYVNAMPMNVNSLLTSSAPSKKLWPMKETVSLQKINLHISLHVLETYQCNYICAIHMLFSMI
jgi:hypothetical protein